MPVEFLTAGQRADYGRYTTEPTSVELSRCFHLDDADHQFLAGKRGTASRLGFALQLTTVRFLGRFPEEEREIPPGVIRFMTREVGLPPSNDGLGSYWGQRQRLRHVEEISRLYGYREFHSTAVGLRLSRWLYAQCWTGTDQPQVLFERATSWMLIHKVLLPGASRLERFVARLRQRVEQHVWRLLGRGVSPESRAKLEALLAVPENQRQSWFDQLRKGPVTMGGPSLLRALERLRRIRGHGIALPAAAGVIPASRLSALARFALRARATAVSRLPEARRLAVMVAFLRNLEASAHDDVLEILESILREIFSHAEKADRRERLRGLRDLDAAATTMAEVCSLLLDPELPDAEVRTRIFARFSREGLARAVKEAQALVRPPDNVFHDGLQERYRRVRLFLPALLEHIRFEAVPGAEAVVAAWDYLRRQPRRTGLDSDAPVEIISKAWRRHVIPDAEKPEMDFRAYIFCVLDRLRPALKRRDVFVTPGWRYSDRRAGLLSGTEWESARPLICRTLGLNPSPVPVLVDLREELDRTYRSVLARLPENPAVRFEGPAGKEELVLSPLDKMEEPASLLALRAAVAARMPRVDLPEVLLEIAARTGFTEVFTHISEQSARAAGFDISVCAVLLAGACNTGIEPLVREDVASLRRDRLVWIDQNYLRDDTLTAANARLVSVQNGLKLAKIWGGGEVASADGMRFTVPVRSVHAGANPKYFGQGRGVTYYNLVSDQFTGLHAITVPGTLRDSLVLLSAVLEQETEFQPSRIMTDTGAYSDVVFGLFRLLGYRFSPRLADIGGTRLWRVDPAADYGLLNHASRHRINLDRIIPHWDDLLRLAGSLKLGKVSPAAVMRSLQTGDRPTRLAQALAEFGRIDKTLHTLNYLDDGEKRRATLIQLNRGESRHSLAREIFHGKRGELRQRYREGQEDQLGSLGLVTNIVILWNTIYIEAILQQLRRENYPLHEEDVARLSPLGHQHINLLGRYSFTLPEAVERGGLRALHAPQNGP